MVCIGINGAGRAGRAFRRLAAQSADLEVAVVNDPLHGAFGIVRGFMTTVHAYTNGQNFPGGWCDNEWGSTGRLADLTRVVAS